MRNDASASPDILFATRSLPSGAFATPKAAAEIDTESEADPYLTADKRRVYRGPSRTGSSTVYVASVTMQSGVPTFAAPERVTGLADAATKGSPVVSDDELDLFYTSATSGGENRIFHATRSERDAPFANVEELTELDVAGFDSLPTWISADACTLYFSSNRTGNGDIFVATRTK